MKSSLETKLFHIVDRKFCAMCKADPVSSSLLHKDFRDLAPDWRAYVCSVGGHFTSLPRELRPQAYIRDPLSLRTEDMPADHIVFEEEIAMKILALGVLP